MSHSIEPVVADTDPAFDTQDRAPSRWRDLLSRMGSSKKALFGIGVILLVVICAAFSPWIAPYDPSAQSLSLRLAPMMATAPDGSLHILGTDHLGRDVLSRAIYGARVGLFVGLAVAMVATLIGVTVGLIAGYFGGWTEAFLMRLCDVQLALPAILLAIAILAITGTSLINIVLILSLTQWVTFARVVRSATLSEREKEYVVAARALGFGAGRIIYRYILPNVFAPVIVIATFSVAQAIIAEAALSFLGLGISGATPSWGAMLADGRTYLAIRPSLATIPGIFITVSVIGINLFGDWLRDFLDPKLKV
jgi:peptide/nickel transport system permease protein